MSHFTTPRFSSTVQCGAYRREKPEAEVDTPLPKASYTVLKDKQIRDLLAAHDLSTAGDRSQLIARHERSVSPFCTNKTGFSPM